MMIKKRISEKSTIIDSFTTNVDDTLINGYIVYVSIGFT